MSQPLAPTLQFASGVVIVHEPMPPTRWLGFGLIRAALVIFTADLLAHARRGRLDAAADIPVAAADAH